MIARNSRSIIQNTHRSFSIATPIQRLHFIDHPRYGKVYPVVTLNQDTHYRKTAMSSTVMLTLVNTSILYSTFINQIFTAAFSAIFANPIFLLPSLGMANDCLAHGLYCVPWIWQSNALSSRALAPL